VPILMLTARGRAEDVLQGFASGADDYLPKPFELAILIARLESLLRRSVWMKDADPASAGASDSDATTRPAREGESEAGHDTFNFGGKSIDFQELELRTLGNTIHLTVMEAELLRYLVRSEGRVVSRKSILEDVWGLHEDTDTRAIDNFVVRLRRYIEEDPSQPKHLQTVRGVGYRFVAEPE
jgi:DNA-binding response OmpR family regulator